MSDFQFTSEELTDAVKKLNEWLLGPAKTPLSIDEDGIIVTENESRPTRPDSTIEEGHAESRAEQIIKDLDAGLVSRRSAERVRSSADRVVKGHDLSRGLGRV